MTFGSTELPVFCPAIAIAPVVTGISLEIMTFGQVRMRGGRVPIS